MRVTGTALPRGGELSISRRSCNSRSDSACPEARVPGMGLARKGDADDAKFQSLVCVASRAIESLYGARACLVSRVLQRSSLYMSSRSVLVLGCCVAATATAADAWQPLRELLDGWEFTDNYAISVGDASGQLFQYIGKGGNVSMKTVLPTGSTSKWPSAMMFAGLVADGTIASLDSKVSDYVSWWTKNASDPRSMVTLKMLLSFTSGFGGGAPGDEGNSRAARRWRAANGRSAPTPTSAKAGLAAVAGEAAASACDEEKGDTTECGQSIYEHVKLIGTPGQVYSYNSNHLQIAAAMAVAASGLPIHEVTKKYLLTPYGMTDSYYDGKCPDFGVDLMTTGEDYEKFLSGVLTYKPLPRAIVDASEQDYTKFLGTNYTMCADCWPRPPFFECSLLCALLLSELTRQVRRLRLRPLPDVLRLSLRIHGDLRLGAVAHGPGGIRLDPHHRPEARLLPAGGRG